jgi:multiple antibiotic resistance protein
MSALLNGFLLVFAALFPIVNPPGTALLFLAMTRRGTHADRAALARRIAIYAFMIMVASLYIGAFVLALFGISIPVLRVAGGIVVALTGWQLLHGEDLGDNAEAQRAGDAALHRMAFYPLTMPLTTGPGTIAVTIALGAGRPETVGHFDLFGVGALLAALAVALLILVCYRNADRVEQVVGKTASDAMAKLFAFILICIGIEIFWAGFSELWRTLPR